MSEGRPIRPQPGSIRRAAPPTVTIQPFDSSPALSCANRTPIAMAPSHIYQFIQPDMTGRPFRLSQKPAMDDWVRGHAICTAPCDVSLG